jgi:hypothetical protein
MKRPKLLIAVAVLAAACLCFLFHRKSIDQLTVSSVMILGDHSTKTYPAGETFKVLRGGRVVFERRDEPTTPILRVDLEINGEPVTIYARAE